MRVPLNDLSRSAPEQPALERAMNRVVARGSFVLGDEVAAFERAFADYCGVAHCVGVANGSDALEITLRALGVSGGDDVVTVANAAMYSTLAILACGATPVYVDVADETLTLDPVQLEAALTPRTRAVVVTHLYGRMADLDGIRQRARGIPIVEDCAQAHGARNERGRAGSQGDAGCFSFYPTKNLGALGDGGAITTTDGAVATRVRALRQYGWTRKYHVAMRGGRNSRLDELQAAVLALRLPRLDERNGRRRHIVETYVRGIRHPEIRVMRAPDDEGAFVGHLAVVRSRRRDDLARHLASHGVGCDVHYPVPDHRQEVMAGAGREVRLPVTERACAEVLTLPCFPELDDAEIAHVIEACNSWPPSPTR